jgi:hypothetical protein
MFLKTHRHSSHHHHPLGSYGSSPLPVLKAANDIALEAEARPDVFHRITSMQWLVEARKQIAKFIGAARTDEVVLTTNASLGLNTILRNIEWEKGDTILVSKSWRLIPIPQFNLELQQIQHTTLFIALPNTFRTFRRIPLSPFWTLISLFRMTKLSACSAKKFVPSRQASIA